MFAFLFIIIKYGFTVDMDVVTQAKQIYIQQDQHK